MSIIFKKDYFPAGVLYHDLLNILDYILSKLLEEYSIYKLVSIIIDENVLSSQIRVIYPLYV